MVDTAKARGWMKTASPQTQGGPQQPSSVSPNGPQSGTVTAMLGAPHHTPQPPYQQIAGTTPTHANSPAPYGPVAGSSSSFTPQLPNSGSPTPDINVEFWDIDTSKLNDLKVQVGVPNKEIPALTIEDIVDEL